MKYFIVIATLALGACGSSGTSDIKSEDVYIGTISWADGDSGRLDDLSFRLKNVDSAESGPVGSAIGGALCEQEREQGLLAKDFMISLTENAAIIVTQLYSTDRYDRAVLDISADGTDVASAGLEAGFLKPWPHDNDGNSLSAKPDWCS